MTTSAPDSAIEPTYPLSPRKGRRSFLPRFGLRTALIVAVVFCLLLAWIGRNLVQMRREDAAIEMLKRAGATVYVGTAETWGTHPATPMGSKAWAIPVNPSWDYVPSSTSRLLGWPGKGYVRQIDLYSDGLDSEKLDAALATLATFPEIQRMELYGPGIDDDSLKALTPLSNLKSLGLARTSVTAQGLAGIDAPKRFRSLSLSEQDPPADAIAGIPALEELRALTIHTATLTDEQLTGIASLPELESLQLWDVGPQSPNVYAQLAYARNLKSLRILASDFRVADVASISDLPRLTYLFVADLDDDGLKELGSPPRLRWLALSDRVTPATVRNFAADHPNMIVAHYLQDGEHRYLGTDEIGKPASEEWFESQISEDDEAAVP